VTVLGRDYLLTGIFFADIPFRARREGCPVVPAIIDDGEAVTRPVCCATMYPQSASGKSRHFYHVSDDVGQRCSNGGESETHERAVAWVEVVTLGTISQRLKILERRLLFFEGLGLDAEF
jgi:hypothetical protein